MTGHFQKTEYSDVECSECGDLIPAKRMAVLPHTQTCVGCMEDLEAQGLGTKKHHMTYNVTIKGDDIDSIETTIVRQETKR